MTITNPSTSTSNRSLSPADVQAPTSILKKVSPERYNIAANDSPGKVLSSAPTATFGDSPSVQVESAAELAIYSELKRKNQQLEEELRDIRYLMQEMFEAQMHASSTAPAPSGGSGGEKPPDGNSPKRNGGTALPGANEPHLAIAALMGTGSLGGKPPDDDPPDDDDDDWGEDDEGWSWPNEGEE